MRRSAARALLVAAVAMADENPLNDAPYWWHSEDPIETPHMKLHNGLSLPRVGYGCAGRAPAKAVADALMAGARLLDTAQAAEWYDEAAAADGLEMSGVPRHDVVVVTKLHPRDHGRKTCARRIVESVSKFGGYVDVFLQHYPACWDGLCGDDWQDRVEGDWRDSWRAMEDAYEVGAVKAIGVSNVDVSQLQDLLAFARVKPHVVQAWMDPFHSSKRLREACAAHGIGFMAYSSLGTQWEAQRRPNPVWESPELAHVAKRRDASVADVVLSWALQSRAVVIPRSRSPEHIRANANLYEEETGVLKVVLDEHDMKVVDGLDGFVKKVPVAADDTPVVATFVNAGDERVEIFWRPPGGGRDVKVGLLEPAGVPKNYVEISTFLGHSFSAKLERGGIYFAAFSVARPGKVTFTVRDPEKGPDL